MLSDALITRALAEDAAFSRRRRLQPIGGQGDKIFPPTYPGDGGNAPPRHVFERRRIPDASGRTREVWCVLIDSVQSQANRLEEALLAATADGLDLPRVSVDFRGLGLEPLTEITSLDAPHRVYDAILRDSVLDGVPFMRSEPGKRLAAATLRDASALLEHSPTALLFGAWHSQGEGGGLGAKFARTLVSEIVGVDVPVDDIDAGPVSAARRGAVRTDPTGISKEVPIYKAKEPSEVWTVSEQDAEKEGKSATPVLYRKKKGDKPGRASLINHSNIIAKVQPLGVTCEHAEHAFTLSFAALRRLRFGGGERDVAGRRLLAALGLVALTEQDAQGYALRSRCDLVPDKPAPLQLVRADGAREDTEITREAARALYDQALSTAREAGFRFESLMLKPQEKLVELVRKSRELALEGKGGEDDDASVD